LDEVNEELLNISIKLEKLENLLLWYNDLNNTQNNNM
jgi:hypothetical protein